MSWNINRFSNLTLTRAEFNEWYILEAIMAQQHDIVVVIEVQSTNGLIGSRIAGSGRTGVVALLASLQAEDAASDWRLVPPVRLNDNVLGPAYTEGIAVYYRNAAVTFTGPYFNGVNGSQPGGPGVAYAGPWVGCLPGGSTLAPRITWGRNFPDVDNRPPMFTTFTEIANGRTIRLMSVHLPPKNAKAAEALIQVGAIPQLLGGLAAPDVAVTIGDVNYDPTKAATTLTKHRVDIFRQSYNFRGFTAVNGVTRIADVLDGGVGLVAGGRREYQLCRARNGQRITSYLDNGYIRWGAGAAPGAVNPLVADLVAGTPPYATSMALSIAQITAQGIYNHNNLFREEQNYGHIARWAGVSDHLPIVIDVP
jgi:hypothetical protein